MNEREHKRRAKGPVSPEAVGTLIWLLDSDSVDRRRFSILNRLMTVRDSDEFQSLPDALREKGATDHRRERSLGRPPLAESPYRLSLGFRSHASEPGLNRSATRPSRSVGQSRPPHQSEGEHREVRADCDFPSQVGQYDGIRGNSHG